MKGFSSRMNMKTFGKVDVISRLVYPRARALRSLRIYHRVILENWRNESRVSRNGVRRNKFIYLFRHTPTSQSVITRSSLPFCELIILMTFPRFRYLLIRYHSLLDFSSLFGRFVDNSAGSTGYCNDNWHSFLFGLFLNGFHDSRREISSGRELKFVMVRFHVRQSIWTYV